MARRSTGALSIRFVGDPSAVRNWVARGVTRLIAAAITAPLALLALGMFDARLALTAGAAIALAAGLEAPTAGAVTPDGAAPGADARRQSDAGEEGRSRRRRALRAGGGDRAAGGLDGRVEEGGPNLSTGERQGLPLARAALARPRLMLLDAPLAELDAAGRKAALALIVRTPATVLAAGLDTRAVARMGRVWRMEAGSLSDDGPPAQRVGAAA